MMVSEFSFYNMIQNKEIIVVFCMYLAHIFYFAGFLPQIVKNYLQKSGKGVSEFFLLGYLNAYFFLLVYIFCMDLPFAYKLLVPFQALAAYTLIAQRIHYDVHPHKRMAIRLYGINAGLFLLFIPYTLQYPFAMGQLFGWLNFLLFATNQLPQVFKIYTTKSVAGFSILFVLLNGSAAVFEMIGAFLAGLPIQTCLSAVRGVLVCLIFCYQFMLYKE